MPPRSMISPAKMKKGSASRMKLPVPFTMACGNATIGAASAIHRYVAVASNSPKPTGTPVRIATKNRISDVAMAWSPEIHGCHQE